MAVTVLLDSDPLLRSVVCFVRQYMSQNVASHNFEHIQRVVNLSQYIYSHSKESLRQHLDIRLITLSALLHDVGDRKYLKSGEDPFTMVYTLLRTLGAPDDLAARVQAICLGVSYSSEVRDPDSQARRLVATIPSCPRRRVPPAITFAVGDDVDADGARNIDRARPDPGVAQPGEPRPVRAGQQTCLAEMTTRLTCQSWRGQLYRYH